MAGIATGCAVGVGVGARVGAGVAVGGTGVGVGVAVGLCVTVAARVGVAVVASADAVAVAVAEPEDEVVEAAPEGPQAMTDTAMRRSASCRGPGSITLLRITTERPGCVGPAISRGGD